MRHQTAVKLLTTHGAILGPRFSVYDSHSARIGDWEITWEVDGWTKNIVNVRTYYIRDEIFAFKSERHLAVGRTHNATLVRLFIERAAEAVVPVTGYSAHMGPDHTDKGLKTSLRLFGAAGYGFVSRSFDSRVVEMARMAVAGELPPPVLADWLRDNQIIID